MKTTTLLLALTLILLIATIACGKNPPAATETKTRTPIDTETQITEIINGELDKQIQAREIAEIIDEKIEKQIAEIIDEKIDEQMRGRYSEGCLSANVDELVRVNPPELKPEERIWSAQTHYYDLCRNETITYDNIYACDSRISLALALTIHGCLSTLRGTEVSPETEPQVIEKVKEYLDKQMKKLDELAGECFTTIIDRLARVNPPGLKPEERMWLALIDTYDPCRDEILYYENLYLCDNIATLAWASTMESCLFIIRNPG